MQHECIPQAILGMDNVCQAKSGIGRQLSMELAKRQIRVYMLCRSIERGVISKNDLVDKVSIYHTFKSKLILNNWL